MSVPSLAPAYAEVALPSPEVSEVEVEGSRSPSAPDAVAVVDQPPSPPAASMPPVEAADRADVLRPVPDLPRAVAGAGPTERSPEAATMADPPAPPAQSRNLEPSPPALTVPSTPPTAAVFESSRPPAIVPIAPPAPRRAELPPRAPGSSPLGLGLAPLRIRLDGLGTRTTDRETDVISGTLIGGQPERVVVQVDDRTSVPTLAGRAFATAVRLSPGLNRVRVLATDVHGVEIEEIVTVRYVPPVTPDVAITSPPDGHTLAPEGPPLVAVEGEVSDPDLSSVWIVASGRRVLVPVTGRRFRHVLPIVEPVTRVRAEAGSEGRRSATVTVLAGAAMPAIGLVLADWPRHTAGPAQMTVMWRPNPAKLDGGAPPMPLPGLPADAGEAGGEFFYLRSARPGVYTFLMTYPAGVAATVRPVLSVAGTSRSLPPVTLNGSGRTLVARVLLPHGVLWEQDDWFSGRSASGDTVTKFRFPEGVSWTERLGDPGR